MYRISDLVNNRSNRNLINYDRIVFFNVKNYYKIVDF